VDRVENRSRVVLGLMSAEHDLDPSAVAYDRELVPWLFEQWAEPMVDLVAPEPSSRIVDIACGSGLIVQEWTLDISLEECASDC